MVSTLGFNVESRWNSAMLCSAALPDSANSAFNGSLGQAEGGDGCPSRLQVRHRFHGFSQIHSDAAKLHSSASDKIRISPYGLAGSSLQF